MRIVYLLILIGVFLVFYLSWEPHKDLKFVWFIPNWLANWTDSHENEDLRTAVPFVFLGLLTGFLPGHSRPVYWWALGWVALVGVVIVAEAGQLLIATRYFSWADIGWGALGALAGLMMAAAFWSIKTSR